MADKGPTPSQTPARQSAVRNVLRLVSVLRVLLQAVGTSSQRSNLKDHWVRNPNFSEEPNNMSTKPKAYLVGDGIRYRAAAFMIRDGSLPGGNISIREATPIMGGSLDGAGNPAGGYSLRGGRMLTTDNHERTWDLYKSIPSLSNDGKTGFDGLAWNTPGFLLLNYVSLGTACLLLLRAGWSRHGR